MAVTSKVLFRGAATTTTTTTLYTVPSATTAVISNIAVTNTAGTAGSFTISLDGVVIHSATAIAANSTVYVDLKQTLAATKILAGGASATSINFHISGVEIA
jgi:hypothetical protein